MLYQSQRVDAYGATVQALLEADLAYRCLCTRRDILDHPLNRSHRPGSSPLYPGTCRGRGIDADEPAAVRLKVPNEPIVFDDRFQGPQEFDLAATGGDFVIRRRDGLYAYQLAVTVDDDFQAISDVVRGCDLLDSTPRQIALRHCLEHPIPAYGHMPIVVNAAGDKLSKQTGARALDLARPGRILLAALAFLRQEPPGALQGAGVREILAWAVAHWRPDAFRGIRSAALPQSTPL